MANLIDNVLDLARGRLAGGLQVNRDRDEPLAPALLQVVDELRSAWPDRPIEVEMNLDAPVDCDPARIAQLLSNLLANALVHGTGSGACPRGLAMTALSSSPWRTAARRSRPK